MLKNCVVMVMVLGAACATDKEEAKGVVDESQPPSIPTEAGKADASAKEIAVNVQSAHPYANNLNKVFQVPFTNLPACANEIRVHFKVLRTEASYDAVSVLPVGAAPQSFDGDRDDTWTSWFPKSGSGVSVRLESDGTVTRHGFEIDKYEWSGSAVCPAIAYPPCAAGLVDVTPPVAVCGCPTAKVCAASATVKIDHRREQGHNRTAHTVTGTVASETHPGPTDAAMTTEIGSVDQAKVASLVKRASDLGLLHGAGYTRPNAATVATDTFVVKAGTKTVTFVAGEGSHDAAVAQLIADYEALFTCGSTVGGLTCGTGFTCDAESASCIEAQTCSCPALDQPVCSDGSVTFANACEADCAGATVVHAGKCGEPGDACGTFRGLTCLDGNKCRFGASQWMYPWPDAGGTCVAKTYCDAPADCSALPHPAVLGAWACTANACAWTAGVPWKPVQAGVFETAHPYASSTSVWKELALPAGAQSLRLVAATGFALESGYDFLEVWSWVNGAWKMDRRYSGTTGPAATDEFAGQYHYLRFVSDSSVNKQGFKVTAEWR